MTLCTSTLSAARPEASSTCAKAPSPFCVGPHSSHLSGVQRTVAFIGSMQAWFWKGYEYTASIPFAAPASTAFTSPPAWLPTKACSASSPALSTSAIVLLDTLAFSPSSQTIGSCSSAVLACHQVSATTATPESPTCTTFLTPFMPLTRAASKLFTLPPNTGQSLIAAFSIPGSFRSAPYTCAPVTFGIVSRRLTDLPISFQSFGSLSATVAGGVTLAAASATLPYVVVRPEGLCVITLLAALHSAAGTFHASAAAWTSITRAVAPPWRTY